MTATALLILLLPLATARIQIDIQASNSLLRSEVYMSGYSEDLISDTEREIFQLTDWEVKDAVYTYSGGRPDDVYLRGPTPWENLYRKYGWKEVKRMIKPKTADILNLRTETVVVDKSHRNMSVRHTWTEGSSYYFDDNVSYNVSFGFGSIGKSRSVFYTNLFGFEHNTTLRRSVGSGKSVVPRTHLRQSVEADSTAKRSVLEVEVTYEATLEGVVACNYAKKFDDHYFWQFDVNICLIAAGKPRTLLTKEVIEVEFYEDATSS